MLNDSSASTVRPVDSEAADMASAAGQSSPPTPDAPPNAGATDPVTDALVACLVEVEQHVGQDGWGQPARLFSLVRTAELVRAEPALAEQLAGASPDSLTAIEDMELGQAGTLEEVLESLRWPLGVNGCAVAFENPAFEEAPGRAMAGGQATVRTPTSGHPASRRAHTCRVVIGVLRAGTAQGVVRLDDGSLRGGVPTWAPNVTAALRETLGAEDADWSAGHDGGAPR